MERKYFTTHKGVAAYLLTQGYQILRYENSKNRDGRPNVKIEFDVDQATGKQVGDAFFDGHATGNLKAFYDACNQVGHEIWKTKGGVDTV
jgi:hypothetical protein